MLKRGAVLGCQKVHTPLLFLLPPVNRCVATQDVGGGTRTLSKSRFEGVGVYTLLKWGRLDPMRSSMKGTTRVSLPPRIMSWPADAQPASFRLFRLNCGRGERAELPQA